MNEKINLKTIPLKELVKSALKETPIKKVFEVSLPQKTKEKKPKLTEEEYRILEEKLRAEGKIT
jgi:hypothetical protein